MKVRLSYALSLMFFTNISLPKFITLMCIVFVSYAEDLTISPARWLSLVHV